MAQRDTRTRVGYDVDRASVNQVIIGNQAIRKSIEGVNNVLGEMNPATAAGINMLMTRFDLLGRNIQDDRRIVQDLHDDLLKLDNVVVEPQVRVKQTGGGGGRDSNGLERVDRASSVLSQVLSGAGMGEAANLTGLVADVASGAGSLGVMGLAVAALTPVIGIATSAINKNIERETNRAQVIEQVSQIISDATTQELDARIRGYQQEIEQRRLAIQIQEQESNRSAEYLANLNDFSTANLSVVQSIPQVVDLINGMGAAAAKVDEQNQGIENAQYAIELLTRYRESETIATNDSAAAALEAADVERQLADARRDAFIDEAKRGGQALADRANNRLEVDRMTAEQRQTRALELQRQISMLAANQQFYANQQTTEGGYAAYLLGQQLADMREELIRVTDTTYTYADGLEAEAVAKKAITDQTDNYFDSLTDEVKAQEKLFEARAEYTQAVTEGAAKEKELLDETQDKREEIADETAERIADIEERSAKERYKILRDFNRAWTSAVGERDALAGKQAKIAASDRLEDQAENDADALIKQKKATDKQLAALDRSYDQQYARLIQSLNAEISIKQTAMNRAQIDVINAQNAQALIAAYGAGQQRQIHENMWSGINQTAVQWASNTVNTLRGIMGAYTGSYATQYPMSVGSQPVTLNYNVTGTQNTMTTATFRNLIQAAAARGGAGSAYQ